jgi:ABC-type transport system involved in multi-copper enzyme maturation permease subunit
MSAGRSLAYLRYQLTDYLLNRASLPIILVAFAAGMPLYVMKFTPGYWQTPEGASQASMMFRSTVALFLPVGAFLASVNLISVDRQQGHVRFFFSKPVNVLGYYGQAYVLHGVTFTLLFGLITWLFGQASSPIPVIPAMEAAVLTFVLVGSLGFLLGALTRYDGGAMVLIYVVATLTQQIVAQTREFTPARLGDIPAVVRYLAAVLPPAHSLDRIRTALYTATAVDMTMLLHVVGYSAGAIVIGVIALRRLPLAR